MSEWQTYDYASLRYDADSNILYFKIKQDIEVDEKVISEMLRYAEDLMGSKRHYCIVDFGSNVDSTTEGRKIYAESAYIQKYRIADAFIVNSLALRMVANFFIQVTKPKVKTRMFSEESQAIKWLEGITEVQIN